MKGKIELLSFIFFVIVLQLCKSNKLERRIIETKLSTKNEINDFIDEGDDEALLSSLSIYEAPNFIDDEQENRVLAYTNPCRSTDLAIEYDGNDRNGTINRIMVGEELYFGTINPYSPNQYMKWIFRNVGTTLQLSCWSRIRTSPGCIENKLSVFSGKGFNQGKRYCGWWNDISIVHSSRAKIVFKSGASDIINRGACCKMSCL